MEMEEILKASNIYELISFFQALPPSLKKLPPSQAKKLSKKKPSLTLKFAERLAESFGGDLQWISQDVDLLQEKIDRLLPTWVSKYPLAKRAFRNWQ